MRDYLMNVRAVIDNPNEILNNFPKNPQLKDKIGFFINSLLKRNMDYCEKHHFGFIYNKFFIFNTENNSGTKDSKPDLSPSELKKFKLGKKYSVDQNDFMESLKELQKEKDIKKLVAFLHNKQPAFLNFQTEKYKALLDLIEISKSIRHFFFLLNTSLLEKSVVFNDCLNLIGNFEKVDTPITEKYRATLSIELICILFNFIL